MKIRKLQLAVLSATLLSTFVFAKPEVSGKITYESAQYTNAGTSTGDSVAHGDNDTFKSEASARIYLDGELENLNGGSSYHVEFQAFNDDKAVGEHDKNESYTQRDPLREAYIDTQINDWSIRAGKQQVVWGTADGAKLLDIINPTDYSEMAQNQMEDSRIPVWMLNAETNLNDGGNFQFILSQPRENIFAGLDRNISTSVRDNGTTASPSDTTDVSNAAGTKGHSQGHPFILKGVDSMAGKVNGFVNIVPDLGSVAKRFYGEFGSALEQTVNVTVGGFASMTAAQVAGGFSAFPTVLSYADGSYDTAYGTGTGIGYDGAMILGGFASAYDTNLMNASNRTAWRSTVDSTFEYMTNATFATFDTFAGAKSQWVYNMPDDSDLDLSMRYKNTTANGTNYSFNYSYAYDKNPIVNLSWRNDAGQELTQEYYQYGSASNQTTSIFLKNGSTYYGARGNSGSSGGIPTLRFEQTVERAHNIGGSFDTTIETEKLGPVVIRGEAVYQKDVYSPVMDLAALSIGDMTKALTMQKGDKLKYVIGADMTALTNMMVSLQFIEEINLDFVDISDSHPTGNGHISMYKYTADYATMHLTNGMNKGEEIKDFISLYLSKPFGESGQHRWNNILMLEENGGRWNRFDVEYTINDNTIATAEYNKYWGDANTQFGQLENSSNVQLGVKYSF